MQEGNLLFPIFLKLDQLQTLVVGGGAVGLEKLQALLSNSPEAKVKLVAPQINVEIEVLAQLNPNVELIKRPFEEQDLDGTDLLILATANRDINRIFHTGQYATTPLPTSNQWIN